MLHKISAKHAESFPASVTTGIFMKTVARPTTDSSAKSIWRTTVPLLPLYFEVIIVSFLINLLALAAPIFSMQIYDRVVYAANLSTLQALTVGMIVVILFDLIFRFARSAFMQKAALRIDVRLSQQIFKKFLHIPLAELETKPSAFWHATFRDIEIVRNSLSGPTTMLLIDLPFAFVFAGFIFVIAQPIAWVLAILLPSFVILSWLSASKLSGAAKEEKNTGYTRDVMLSEIIAGRSTVKALSLYKDILPLWEKKQAESISASLLRGQHTDKYYTLGYELTTFSTIAFTAIGSLAIMELQLTVGALIAANMLVNRVVTPFNQLVTNWRNFSLFGAAAERLNKTLAVAEDRQQTELEPNKFSGEIAFESVSFSYNPSQPPALSEVRIKIAPRQMVAIVGANGSGKTTLVKVMQGLYAPSSGRVLLDGADIRQFTREQIARWVGYVPQDLFLFSTSIYDNLIKGHPNTTSEEILAAAQVSGLHSFVADLPDGYDTQIGEGGRLLSSGLRQRIAVTRALLGEPSILILDEPSSNLDHDGEVGLVQGLRRIAEKTTVLVISHSPIVLASCDLVYVMQKGRVVRSGAPMDILPRGFLPQRPAMSSEAIKLYS